MLDRVRIDHYRSLPYGLGPLRASLENRARAREVARELMEAAQRDVAEAHSELDALRVKLAADGFQVSRVRLLDVLIWTEYEDAGSYRDPGI